MSSYVSKRRYCHTNGCDCDVIIRCDGCGRKETVAEGQTDRLLVNDYVHANGWKTTKKDDRWINLCPDCVSALREKRRNEWLKNDGFTKQEEKILQESFKAFGENITIIEDTRENEKRAEWRDKEKSKSLNSLYFLNREEKNDIGFGGTENLCNMQNLIKALEKYNLKREDVHFGWIRQYLAYHRWIMARKLYSEGLTVYKVAEKMHWKYERIIKAIDDDQFGQLKAKVEAWLTRCHKAISAE